jgi:hypothetical protein
MFPEPIEFLKELTIGTKFEGIDIIEILQNPELFSGEKVHEELSSSHRWWDEWLHVVKFGNIYIGYLFARANRDESVFDLGWEFDTNSIVYMKPIEKTIITYIKE